MITFQQLRYAVLIVLLAALQGCGYIKGLFPDKEKDYQYTTEIPPLQLPADLNPKTSATDAPIEQPAR
jgi:outer membrane protein assembly factor BamC